MTWPNRGLAHRPVVSGRKGAVASAHPQASLAGLRILQQGGNAVDAVVAVAAALNVVEPYMSGAGGVGYMTIAVPGRSTPIVLEYIGRAPAAATLDMFSEPGSKDDGIRSPLVPGALGGWLAALERFGTMDRATVFAPAIEYARDGFPVTIKNHEFIDGNRERVLRWPTSTAAYLHDGATPTPGSILKQPDLARTFEAVVEGGADVLYHGPIGAEIARFSQENGGLLTVEDLAGYTPSWQEPISTTYRGFTTYCPPLPCTTPEPNPPPSVCVHETAQPLASAVAKWVVLSRMMASKLPGRISSGNLCDVNRSPPLYAALAGSIRLRRVAA